MQPQKIGIIDMGSNSVRFVIYDVDRHACYSEILNLKVAARLSSYINKEDGAMKQDGISLIIKTLDKFAAVAEKYHLTELRCVATAAVRNASNQREIIQSVRKHASFNIDVLSEEEEAYYGYLAVTNSTSLSEGITVDIGGGSTEVTYFENREVKYLHSFPFGAITLKKQFLSGDTPTKKEWSSLETFLNKQFSSLTWLHNRHAPVIGIGGTARNIALVHQNLISYPLGGLHQYEMSEKDVTSVLGKLSSQPLKRREKTEGLSKDRADIILPAMKAITELLSYSGSDRFIISSKGLRDGLFYEQLLNNIDVTHFPDVAQESFYQLAVNYQLDEVNQRRISILAAYLVSSLPKENSLHLDEYDFKLLKWAANIFYVGASIHQESKSQHTFYLLTNQSVEGLSHKDRMGVAFMASFKSRSQLKSYAAAYRKWLTKEELEKYELMGAALKFCYALNISGLGAVKSMDTAFYNKKEFHINIYYSADAYFEEFHANKYKKHLEKALNKQISLSFKKL